MRDPYIVVQASKPARAGLETTTTAWSCTVV